MGMYVGISDFCLDQINVQNFEYEDATLSKEIKT